MACLGGADPEKALDWVGPDFRFLIALPGREVTGRSRDDFAAYIARQLTWTRRETPFADLDDMNQMLAVCETVAHLDVLAARFRISS